MKDSVSQAFISLLICTDLDCAFSLFLGSCFLLCCQMHFASASAKDWCCIVKFGHVSLVLTV